MSDKLRVIIVGAGAVGAYIGASLVRAGNSVGFLVRPRTALALANQGLQIGFRARGRRRPRLAGIEDQIHVSSPRDFEIFGRLPEALETSGPDLLVHTLKSYDTVEFLESAREVASILPDVLCLTNGVESEDQVAAIIGRERVIPAALTTAVGRAGETKFVVERRRGVGVAAGNRLSAQIKAEFDAAGLDCRIYGDGTSMKWSKLLTNLLANPTSAILDMRPGDIFAHPGLFDLEIRMLRECLAVMQALRLHVVDLPRIPVRALALATRLPPWLSRRILGRAAGSGRGAKMPSFHIDLRSGRGKSEVDALHGAVARAGALHGVPTPVNRMLTDTLLSLTRGELPIDTFAGRPDRLLEKLSKGA